MNQSDGHCSNEVLRVLHLEDNQNDSELIQRELETEWTKVELLRVNTREAFILALADFKPDVVLSGYQLPGMNGREGLAIVRAAHPEIPVVMVTSALDEMEAVDLLKQGARDYVMKDRMQRLNSAIKGALALEQGIRLRKQVESNLKESEARYQAIMDSANDAIICLRPDGCVELWNRKAEEMFGYTADEMLGRDLHTLITPERYRDQATSAMQHFFKTGTGKVIGTQVQLDARHKDGREFPVELSISAMNIHGAWHASGIVRDISERTQAEEALRESETRFKLFMDALPAAAFIKDNKSRSIYCNRYMAEILGGKNWLGKTPYELFPQKLAEDMVADDQTALELGDAIREEQVPHANGDLRYYRTHKFAIPRKGHPTMLGGLAFDITENKRVENELRQLSLAVEQSPSSILITDLDANIQYVNEAFVQVTGYRREEVLGQNPRLLHSGKNSPELYQEMWAHLTKGEVWQGELINRRKDGAEYVESVLISPVFDAEGHPQNYLAIKMDITERKQAEIRQSRYLDRIAGLLKINELGGVLEEKDFLHRGLALIEDLTESPISCIHFVNEDQVNIELAAWSARTLESDCSVNADRHCLDSDAGIWAECLRQQKAVIFNDYQTYTAKHGLPAGHSRLVRLISVPVIEEDKVRVILGVGNRDRDYTDEDVEVVQLFGNDIWRIIRRQRAEAELAANLERMTILNSELRDSNGNLKSARQQLLQSEKMAAIGLLAAGVAHEINNPVGYVNSNLGTLEKYLADVFLILDKYENVEPMLPVDDATLAELHELKTKADLKYIREDLASLVSESHQGLERIKKIILDLKDFSRSDVEEKWMWADVHHGLDSTLNVVWNELKYKCEVVKEYGTLPQIYCLPSQLNQVFMNLLVNAAQAIEVRGKITIRTGQEGDRVWIEVSDTGKGISREHIHRLFDPFFTTKPIGKGTGLGLSVSYNIVEKHHGTFEVTSEVGQGATFRVWLPVQQPENKEKA